MGNARRQAPLWQEGCWGRTRGPTSSDVHALRASPSQSTLWSSHWARVTFSLYGCHSCPALVCLQSVSYLTHLLTSQPPRCHQEVAPLGSGDEGGVPRNGICALLKGPQGAPSPCPHHARRQLSMKQEALTGCRISWRHELGHPRPQNYENQMLVYTLSSQRTLVTASGQTETYTGEVPLWRF